MKRLQSTVRGLHALLPDDARFSFSLLVPVSAHCDPSLLKQALISFHTQTSLRMEILVGVDPVAGSKFDRVIQEQSLESKLIKHISIPNVPHGSNISAFLTNELARYAVHHYLILMHPEDWVRPDFLFRYEQFLRLIPEPETTVIFCDEYLIDGEGKTNYFHEIRKKDTLHFPYYFSDELGRGVAFPRGLWESVGGLKITSPKGWEIYDLTLRLDPLGTFFRHIPLFLYARRDHCEESGELPLIELREYVQSKSLSWDVTEGFNKQALRAVPKLDKRPSIHVIIPFKDQKDMTLATVASLSIQEGVDLKVTAVDNNSSDPSIALELAELGIEVLLIQEPFNYSRLNNLAVEKTQIGQDCELLLFLNNDVELEPRALIEMSRWAFQPGIGLVGCRLLYPNQTLQHGGVILSKQGPGHLMVWNHLEKGQSWHEIKQAKKLGVVDAVTAAAAMIRRNIFLGIGGFDAIYYPIAFSDTNLAQRLTRRGLNCFYTPYASGIHHESLSRQRENIEDFESSRWLSDLMAQKDTV